MIFSGLTFPEPESHQAMDNLSQSDGDNSQGEGRSGSSTKKGSNSAAYEMIALDACFEPTSLDVICARGKEAYNHTGNIRFRQLVQDQLHNYQSSTSKMAKSQIVREIIESVRRSSPKGGFVKKVNGKWWDVGERARREKTGQQIRDLLHTQYRSSTKSKAMTRKRLRKSHSANSATRAHAAQQAAAMGVTSAFAQSVSGSSGGGAGAGAGAGGRLPARIVTLDSQTNSVAAAAARSALAFQGHHHFRHNSEPDLASMAATARATEHDLSMANLNMRENEFNLNAMNSMNLPVVEPSFTSLGRIRETEPTLSMNRLMNMNMNSMNMNSMNMNRSIGGLGSLNQSSMHHATMNSGWGSALVGDDEGGFPPLQHSTGQLLQQAHQRQQLSDLSGLLQQQQQHQQQQQQQQQPQPSFTGSSQSSSYLPFGGSSQFDNTVNVNTSSMMGVGVGTMGSMSSFNPQNSMAFQSSRNTTTSASASATAAHNVMQMQQSYASSSNTRPQDATFSDSFQRSGRMVRPVPQEQDFDPLLLPVDSNFFKEEQQQQRQRQQHPQEQDDDESEKSFEEAIDNIYGLDGPTPTKRI